VTMLAELKRAIQQLQEQKDALLDEIQKVGWEDDRSRERIPEVIQGFLDFKVLDAVTIVPERSPLPPNCSRNYQQWYSAARAMLAKNQPGRMGEFDQSYSEIKGLLQEQDLEKNEQFKLMDLINFQFEVLAAVPSHLRFSMYDIELTAYSVLMDDELEASRYLCSNGFLRPAGVLAGVIQYCIPEFFVRKATPYGNTLSEFGGHFFEAPSLQRKYQLSAFSPSGTRADSTTPSVIAFNMERPPKA